MTDLTGYVATGVISLAVGWLLKYVEPKARLLYWFPHNFLFHLKNENVALQTNSLTIQNIGRRPAENVEIVHKQRPDFFQLAPAMPFVEETTANGEHVVRVATLGPKEVFTVQLLSYKTVPVLLNVRSKDGAAVGVAIQPQRIFPKWFQFVSGVFFFTGMGFLVYWAIKAVIFISKSIGIA